MNSSTGAVTLNSSVDREKISVYYLRISITNQIPLYNDRGMYQAKGFVFITSLFFLHIVESSLLEDVNICLPSHICNVFVSYSNIIMQSCDLSSFCEY